MGTIKRALFCAALALAAFASADHSVYSEQLDNSWQSWSWAPIDPASTAIAHSGSRSIAVTPNGPWQAMYLHHNSLNVTGFQTLTFWIHGGATGGQLLQMSATLGGGVQVNYTIPTILPNAWQKIEVPLTGLGVSGTSNFDGFWIQDRSGTTGAPFAVDDISLVSKPASVALQNAFSDTFLNGWVNWSWASVNAANTSPVHLGTKSIAVTGLAPYDGFYIHHEPFDGSLQQTFRFWINGGAAGGQQLKVNALASGVPLATFDIPTLPKNSWQQIIIPLYNLGASVRGDIDGFWILDRAGVVQPTYYLDDIFLSPTPPSNGKVVIRISTATQQPISPYIYGVNFADFASLGSGFRFARQGGNRLTAYNWENNASNAGSDWYFQNDGLMGSTDEPGWAGRTFVQDAISHGAVPIVTIPTAGYVSADKLGDGDVRNTPDYLNVRFKKSLPVKPGAFTLNPDTSDAFVYQDEFVNFITQFAQPGYPIMFDLDNEPDLWAYTHAEIHPTPATYAEMIDSSTAYAAAIKNVYPPAMVFGPVSYGWYGFRTLQGAVDGNGRDFVDFYLAGMKQAETDSGKRLLDVLDLHWYPEAQGGGQRITTTQDSPEIADARIASTRSLWDPTYVENSWIAQSLGYQPIKLLPDTFGRIATHYPGTKLAVTEYNYGGAFAMSGAIAQADVLGIFGRYGVFAAANWGLSADHLAELAGFKAFTNYDRAGARFGDRSLSVTGEKADTTTVYASMDSTKAGRMTIVVINKSIGTTPFDMTLTGYTPTTVKNFVITEGHYTTPARIKTALSGSLLRFVALPRSITTLELQSVVP